MPRFFCPAPLIAGQALSLPAGAARHAQVLRLQPGRGITLFNGEGGQHPALIEQMGRSDVTVRVGPHEPVEREAARQVHLAIGMPANERMDWLVEKATELGAAGIWPLLTGRGVLRLAGERSARKQAHWQAIAIAACEQCGRNRVPRVHEVQALADWLKKSGPAPADAGTRLLLSLRDGAQPLGRPLAGAGDLTFLSGPEGGLSPAEEAAAIACGFAPVTLGPRVLRAETAPLAVLAALL